MKSEIHTGLDEPIHYKRARSLFPNEKGCRKRNCVTRMFKLAWVTHGP